MNNNTIYNNQIAAAILHDSLIKQGNTYIDTLSKIQCEAMERMQYADTALMGSFNKIDNIRDFVASPENILGSIKTKHGEVAEQIEVNIRNGRSILQGLKPTATFDNVGRLAPEDYLIGSQMVQSKFIAGTNNSLNHIITHLEKYPDFSAKGFYHIPKDQHEILNKVIQGKHIEGLNSKSINNLKSSIFKIEQITNKPFSKIVQPGISSYQDVQLGRVGETLQKYEDEFIATDQIKRQNIRADEATKKAAAESILSPSWGEALKYAAVGAGISATVSSGLMMYSKLKEGKRVSEFTLNDWKDIGYEFTKGGAKGSISALGIYGMTKIGGFSAPFAGAIVSATVGGSSLFYRYQRKQITEQEFSDSMCALCIESALAAIGASLGQTFIPIPVLGAIIGTAVAKASLEITRSICTEKEKELIQKLENEYNTAIKNLNDQAKVIIAKMDNYFNQLHGYIQAAMSEESAARFYGSIELCRFLKVPEDEIIKSKIDLDNYMNS